MTTVFNDTREAAVAACQYLAGRTPLPGLESQQVEQLNTYELQPFTRSVRLTVAVKRIDGKEFRTVQLWANDEGCVNNNGRPLADCWLEGGLFYYEA